MSVLEGDQLLHERIRSDHKFLLDESGEINLKLHTALYIQPILIIII